MLHRSGPVDYKIRGVMQQLTRVRNIDL